MGTFESGIGLNAAFYAEVVAPVLSPWPHSAGLLGWGSEILGFDTARSTDHGWGPRLRVFVESSDVARAQAALDATLPSEFHGWPVRYGWDDVAAEHRVRVSDLGSWLVAHLGHDPRVGMDGLDWLVMPQQLLLAARWFGRPTGGFHGRALGRRARHASPCVVQGRTRHGCPRRSGLNTGRLFRSGGDEFGDVRVCCGKTEVEGCNLA